MHEVHMYQKLSIDWFEQQHKYMLVIAYMNLLTIYIEAIQMKGIAHMHTDMHVLSMRTLHAHTHAGAHAYTGRFMHTSKLAHVHTQSNLATAKSSNLLLSQTICIKHLRQTNTSRLTHDELLLELLEEELEEEEEEQLDELEDDDELQSGHVRCTILGCLKRLGRLNENLPG
jgi:hypothetical protein